MSDHSPIEWLLRPNTIPSTWNPLVGCAKCSQGCKFCYAIPVVWMKGQHPNPKISGKFAGLVTKDIGADGSYKLNWTGEIRLYAPALQMPLRGRAPRTYFIDEFSDLFYELVLDDWLHVIFAIVAASQRHVFIAPTKRTARARDFLNGLGALTPRDRAVLFAHALRSWKLDHLVRDSAICVDWPLPNYWHLGSAEDQLSAETRIPQVLDTNVAVRGVSLEPLIEPINLTGLMGINAFDPNDNCYDNQNTPTTALDWVIGGGESGSTARPAHPSWFRLLRDQCAKYDKPFFFKQWGEWHPCSATMVGGTPSFMCHDETIAKPAGKRFELIDHVDECRDRQSFVRLGKSLSGARLDGREHRAWPK